MDNNKDTPDEGAALSEDEFIQESLDLLHRRGYDDLRASDMGRVWDDVVALRAGAADPLRQAVEALAAHLESVVAPPARETVYHALAADLRRVLDETKEKVDG